MKYSFISASILVLVFACKKNADLMNATDTPSEAAIQSVSTEEKAINQKVLDAYALISFEKGNKPNFDAFYDVFTPYATLLNFRNDSIEKFSISDFKVMFEEMVNSGQVESFHEVELSGETEYFGKIGHRISTYATYINTQDSIAERGINSFQLINLDGKWMVNSIIWDIEKPGQPIPD